ncbi:ASCH domain-containing protein [Paucilactobacillus suebicus]|uniref:ASCH domain-containing protein n=1 Tax=Paucilactobacillus suebicus DSM 5007 = KCTC 3549 TaxID=1423807 RepID=A0A0R1W3C6_9LACO|nr:ASCH domain-containing protein [Paucilactobacillus suebicus]KRM09907.1 hypothetical protein FD16_GL001501 [Paucilactobacillus suebicus DSM 5007 = KCTC 3549]
MLALSIKNPYAMQIIYGDKKIEYRTWPPKNVKEFLLVSSSTPSNVDFGLGLPNGYALAIVEITSVSDRKNRDGNYEWHVRPKMPIKPFKVKGKLHFYDVDGQLIEPLPDLVKSMKEYIKNPESEKATPFYTEFLEPLEGIGTKQMPKKYQKILKETNDWNAVGQAWVDAAR